MYMKQKSILGFFTYIGGPYIIRLAKQNYYQTLSIFGDIKSSCMLMFGNNFDITYLLTKEYKLHLILNGKVVMEK